MQALIRAHSLPEDYKLCSANCPRKDHWTEKNFQKDTLGQSWLVLSADNQVTQMLSQPCAHPSFILLYILLDWESTGKQGKEPRIIHVVMDLQAISIWGVSFFKINYFRAILDLQNYCSYWIIDGPQNSYISHTQFSLLLTLCISVVHLQSCN